MSTLKVASINHPSATSGGIEITSTGIVTGPGLDSIATFAQSGTMGVAVGATRWPIPYNATILSAYAAVGTAPTGANILIDINLNGTTIFTNQANRLTITAGSNYSGINTSMSVTSVAAGQYLTVDVDQVGSTVAGSNLTVFIYYRRA